MTIGQAILFPEEVADSGDNELEFFIGPIVGLQCFNACHLISVCANTELVISNFLLLTCSCRYWTINSYESYS